MSAYLPYVVSVLTALISGLFTYWVAVKHTSSEIELLRKSNEHEIEKLMKQHELDINNIERCHALEMEKMETEHLYQMQMVEEQAKNQITGTFMSELMGAFMSTPEMKDFMGESVKDMKRNGFKQSAKSGN